eukprot:841736_1
MMMWKYEVGVFMKPPDTPAVTAGAGETDVPFFSVAGSDFVKMFVDVSAAMVRNIFEQACNNAPCIISIYEINVILRMHGARFMSGGDSERKSTRSHILTEMDGFKSTLGIVFLGGRNRGDLQDKALKALLRPGWLDREIEVAGPTVDELLDIFKIHMKSQTVRHSSPRGCPVHIYRCVIRLIR